MTKAAAGSGKAAASSGKGSSDGAAASGDGARAATAETATAEASGGAAAAGATTPETLEEDVRFSDSRLVRDFLSPAEADALLEELENVKSSRRRRRRPRYALRTDYYGAPRQTDGALAHDRWGADYESWARVRPLPDSLERARRRVAAQDRGSFDVDGPPANASANSVAVNYYEDQRVPIAAHQDSIASLVEGSPIHCLTLGATREFVLCDLGDGAGRVTKPRVVAFNNAAQLNMLSESFGEVSGYADPVVGHRAGDAGATTAENANVVATFRPRHGDLFVLGPKTNASCCHCVPAGAGDAGLRVSVVFRSVDKSFVRNDASPKVATYADGRRQNWTTEAVVAVPGGGDQRRHVADLISAREAKAAARVVAPRDERASFYRGRGERATLRDDDDDGGGAE